MTRSFARLTYVASRILLSAVVCWGAVDFCLAEPSGSNVEAALDIGSRKQFFIDTKFIAESDNVTLSVNPPRKAGVVLRTDREWDAGRIIYPSIVQDEEGTYRLYYYASDAGENGKLGAASFCLATSKDGLHWEKPDLGLVKYRGSKQNNIVALGHGEHGHVFLDPKAPAAERYKVVHESRHFHSRDKGGIWVGYSRDGLHWEHTATRQLPYACDSHNVVLFDPQLDKYVAYVRAWHPVRKRVVARTELDDVLASWPVKPVDNNSNFMWKKDHPPSLRDEYPVVLQLDEKDPPETDIYTPAVELYPWADSVYLSLFSLYRHDDRKHGNDGPLELQLAVSRDGIDFSRPDRRPYVGLGIRGQDGDWGGIYHVPGMIRDGKVIYQYYVGMNVTHQSYMSLKDVRNLSSVYRTVQRVDGFVSADFDYSGGTLLTPSLAFSGNRLLLNVDCAASGTGRVEIRDAQNRPIPGYTLADCDPIGLNEVDVPVTFHGKSDLGAISQPVRLFFSFCNAKLYAFQFDVGDVESPAGSP